jgi:hypothetical protein
MEASPVTDELALLTDEIRALLDEPLAGERQALLARLEHTLTDGYARALALEAERNRLERRLGQLASRMEPGDAANGDLALVARRVSDADDELNRLRDLLVSLRARAREVRAAA